MGTESPGFSVIIGGAEMQKVLHYYGLMDHAESEQMKVVCPFHQDVNPSMIINLADGNYYCFGCQQHGDALQFVINIEQKYNELTVLQAMQKYFKILNSDEVSKLKIAENLPRRKESNSTLVSMAYDYYYGLRTIDWEFGWDDAVTDDEVFKCVGYMLMRGFDASALNACGAKITYERAYPIVFPMLDNGEFKGWVGRTTDPRIEAKRKYLYNEGFSRATTVVGDYGTKDYVYIVEGYMDRLKFLQYGETNVVAILGWRITDEQVRKLKKAGIRRVISALDNDISGRKGTAYLKTKFKTAAIKYPEGCKDPGDMTLSQFNQMRNDVVKRLL